MKNKDKVIKYMEEESNFNGSFSEIEHRINVQNIVIKENLKKGGVGFGRLKTAFLCLTCSVLCFVGGYSVNHMINQRYTTINKTIEYNTFEEMENAYYEYQELYPEEEITFFDIDMEQIAVYEYFINTNIIYDKNEIIKIDNKKVAYNLYVDFDSYYYITFENNIYKKNCFWRVKSTKISINYTLEDRMHNELIKISSYNNDDSSDKQLMDYIDAKIQQL